MARIRGLPRDEREAAPRLHGRPEVGECGDGVGEERHSEARGDEVEVPSRELVRLRVAVDQLEVRDACLFGALGQAGEHRG
jgi:hypothetical protein